MLVGGSFIGKCLCVVVPHMSLLSKLLGNEFLYCSIRVSAAVTVTQAAVFFGNVYFNGLISMITKG